MSGCDINRIDKKTGDIEDRLRNIEASLKKIEKWTNPDPFGDTKWNYLIDPLRQPRLLNLIAYGFRESEEPAKALTALLNSGGFLAKIKINLFGVRKNETVVNQIVKDTAEEVEKKLDLKKVFASGADGAFKGLPGMISLLNRINNKLNVNEVRVWFDKLDEILKRINILLAFFGLLGVGIGAVGIALTKFVAILARSLKDLIKIDVDIRNTFNTTLKPELNATVKAQIENSLQVQLPIALKPTATAIVNLNNTFTAQFNALLRAIGSIRVDLSPTLTAINSLQVNLNARINAVLQAVASISATINATLQAVANLSATINARFTATLTAIANLSATINATFQAVANLRAEINARINAVLQAVANIRVDLSPTLNAIANLQVNLNAQFSAVLRAIALIKIDITPTLNAIANLRVEINNQFEIVLRKVEGIDLKPLQRRLDEIYRELTRQVSGTLRLTRCDGSEILAPYDGPGLSGLQSLGGAQVQLLQGVMDEVCTKNAACVPVMPHEGNEHLSVGSQLVLTFGENYPYQTGSLWHMSVPNPHPPEHFDWCRDFEPLQRVLGTTIARIYWSNQNRFWTGGYFASEAEALTFFEKILPLTTSTVSPDPDTGTWLRIIKGRIPKRRPRNRTVRVVRVAWIEVDPATGEATASTCWTPPPEGCG